MYCFLHLTRTTERCNSGGEDGGHSIGFNGLNLMEISSSLLGGLSKLLEKKMFSHFVCLYVSYKKQYFIVLNI